MIWFNGSIRDAITTSKQKKSYFVVYVEGTDEQSIIMTKALDNPLLSKKFIEDNFVAIKLVKGSEGHKQFEEFYKLVPVPSIFFIDQNGSPTEVVVSDSSMENVLKKLNNAIDKCIPNSDEVVEEEIKQIVENSISPSVSTNSTNDVKPSTSKDTGSNIKLNDGEVEEKASPSTSSPTKTVEERIEHAKILLEKKKEEKIAEERKKEKESEMERRRVGHEMQMAKRQQQDREILELRAEREKQKKEDAAARQKILDQIAQDRAERAERLARMSATTPASSTTTTSQPEVPPTNVVQPSVSTNSNLARIQFKLPTGETKSHSFPAETTLIELRQFIDNNILLPFKEYQLATTFPRREFTIRDNDRDLRNLNLLPSAVILILPLGGISSNNNSLTPNFGWTSVFVDMVRDIVQSMMNACRQITNMVFRRGGGDNNNVDNNSASNSNRTSTTTRNTLPTNNENYFSSSINGQRLGGTSSVRKRGNIYSLHDNKDDNDENNTWNGNSTQQM